RRQRTATENDTILLTDPSTSFTFIVPLRWLLRPELFASEYELPRFSDVAGPAGLDVDGLAGGAIMEDFDGDDLLDIMVSSMSLRGQLRRFRNNGDGTFADVTEAAGLLSFHPT